MDIAKHLDISETHCRFRPADTVSFVEVVELVTRAIAFCRDRKIPKLLVDVSRLTHLTPPTTMDRFLMVEDWAQEAKGMVMIAVVAPAKLIHPQKFGVKVAADSGLRGDVFTSEREALEWLLAQTE